VAVVGAVRIPVASKDWHPIARDWFRSLARSGQSRFYEPSDWATAKLLADQMSRMLNLDEPNASMLNGIVQATRDLMTTEGQRRRMRLELERAEPDSDPALDEAVADVDNIISLARARA
jgi:hypothetical protein